MEGYLNKYVNFIYGFKRRYFRLQGDVLLYYKSEKATHPKDSFFLPQCSIGISQKDPLKVLIKDNNKTLDIRTANLTEKVLWFNALNKAA